MTKALLKCSKRFFYSCALVGTLSSSEGWSVEITDEEIISPCVAPSVSSSHESSAPLSDEIFDHKKNAFDDQARRESVLKWIERGGDNRKKVEDTKAFPYSTQVYFTAHFPRSQKNTCEIGTGTLIGEDVVLTAAHVIFSHDKGGYYTSLRCIAAPNHASAPFGISEINNVKVSLQYLQKGSDYKSYDYALVFLKDFLGKKTGYMGLASLKDEQYQDLKVTIAGYPADKIQDISLPSMWGMGGGFKSITPEQLYHDIDTYGGQSGSGIWCKRAKENKEEYYLVGVHAYGAEEEQEGAYRAHAAIRVKNTHRAW